MACEASQGHAVYRSGLLERLQMVRGSNTTYINVLTPYNLLTTLCLTLGRKDRIMYTSTEDI
jgi:hypothetical protein